MNEDQKRRLQTRLAGLNNSCVICGHHGFTIADKLFELREFNEGNLVIGGDSAVLPAVILICDRCGAIQMMSALALGVLDNSEKRIKADGNDS